VDWPLPAPKIIMDLVHLEAVLDVLELYVWLTKVSRQYNNS
jgi:ATP-dependent RNA helicase SUPV3L1/SUV3